MASECAGVYAQVDRWEENGSIPLVATKIVNKYWRIAQLVERRAVNSNVVGSSPTPSAKIVNI